MRLSEKEWTALGHEDRREWLKKYSPIARENAGLILKAGDRVRVTKCPGTKRWITFSHFDGHWIVSKSGINDYSPICVDMVNGLPVDFTESAQ